MCSMLHYAFFTRWYDHTVEHGVKRRAQECMTSFNILICAAQIIIHKICDTSPFVHIIAILHRRYGCHAADNCILHVIHIGIVLPNPAFTTAVSAFGTVSWNMLQTESRCLVLQWFITLDVGTVSICLAKVKANAELMKMQNSTKLISYCTKHSAERLQSSTKLDLVQHIPEL